MKVVKRDGQKVNFDANKIVCAINKAAIASKEDVSTKFALEVVNKIVDLNKDLKVEEIQDLVEKELMKTYPDMAKNYIFDLNPFVNNFCKWI